VSDEHLPDGREPAAAAPGQPGDEHAVPARPGTSPGSEIDPHRDPVPDPVPNPGLEAHEPRPTDVDPKLEKRAERQVATLFGLATLLTLAFCVLYFVVPVDATFAGTSGSNLALGGTLGLALLFIGFGAVHWARVLMDDHEIVELRHAAASPDADRAEAVGIIQQGNEESGFGRRPLIRNSLLGAMGVLALPAVVLLRDLGPLPGDDPKKTVWAKGVRVVVDISGQPIKPSDLEVGQLVNAEPSVFFEEDEEGEHLYHGTELLNAKAKAAVIVVRMEPDEINAPEGREDWGIDGVLCFSKICPHLGCPISLWEQQTRNLICPCHQSTFDLADGGKVVFGPAKRPVPQLQLGLDDEGYLIAMGDFADPVGPSWPEMYQDN
jgi:quinol---cytochrome c reductase iron-sulfur subunit